MKRLSSEFARSCTNFFSWFNKSLRVILVRALRDQMFLLFLESHRLRKIKFPKVHESKPTDKKVDGANPMDKTVNVTKPIDKKVDVVKPVE